MHTTFTRLLWKEYRAQRMLWVVLLVGWLAIHLLCVFNETSVIDIMPVIPMIPVCFIVAAGIIAFAGEEEEKTANLLRMLPFRTLTLMSSKLTAVAVGCLTLVVSMLVLSLFAELVLSSVIFIAALVVDRPIGFPFPVVKPTPNSFPWQDGDAFYLPAFLALVFGTSVFCSMVTRRIFSAVGLTVAMILAIVITASTVTFDFHRQLGTTAPWIAGIAVIFMTLSTAVLSRPWHLGRLPRRWTLPETAENSATRRIPSFAWLWRRWLRRIVARPLTMPRILAMLTWRECRSAVPFALTWLAIGLLICSGRYFVGEFYPWPFMFLIVFIHECGQRTMREDQRTQAISLLANLGVHPLQIWLSKTFVWFCVACAVGYVVIATDAVIPAYRGIGTITEAKTRIHDIVTSIRVPEFGFPGGDRSKPSTLLDRDRQINVWLSAVIGLFSLGQLTACWIQRQILAYAASLLIFFLALITVFQVLAKDWPLWITLFPIAMCGLLAPAMTARYWIERRVTWSLRLKQFAMVIVPCTLFFLLGQSVWRVQPIMALASLDRTLDSGFSNVYDPQNSGNSPEITQLLAMTKSRAETWLALDKPEETCCWYEFAAAVERFPFHQMAIPSSHSTHDPMPGNLLLSEAVYTESDPKKIQELLQPFDEVLAKNDAFPLLPISWTGPWSKTPAVALSILLLEDARHREASGDVGGAVQQIVRTIRANRSLSVQTSSWANWLACLDTERVALGRLRILLGTADLSAIDLDSLQSQLTSALVLSHHNGNAVIQLPEPTMMLQRRSLFYGDACLGGTFLERVEKLPVIQRAFEVNERTADLRSTLHNLYGTASASRAFFTMKYSESLLAERYNTMAIFGRIRFLQESRPEWIQQLNRLMATSYVADLNVDLEILSSHNMESYYIVPHIDTIASERATLLTIMLQKYRIAHGKFPENLIDLQLDGNADRFILPDPWTGSPFFYAPPNHTPLLPLRYNTETPPVTPGQPLLFTPGRFGASLKTYLPQPTENGAIEMYKLPENLVLFLGLNDAVDWRYSQVATTVTAASEVKLEPSAPAP